MEVNLEQPEKALCPILVTLSGMLTEVRPVQCSKVDSSMIDTPVGIVMDVKAAQPENASSSISVTLFPKVTDVRRLQSLKAHFPMLVTLSGILMDVRRLQSLYLQLIVYQFVLIKTVEK